MQPSFRAAISLSIFLLLLIAFTLNSVNAQTVVAAYQSRNPVTLDGVVQSGEWSDTPIVTDTTSGLTYAFKHNSTGFLFLMSYKEAVPCPTCFGGIELGHLNNTADMGSEATRTIMILVSPSFPGNVGEFISTGQYTPTPVEQDGYKTQTVCGLNYANGEYIAECYRPFKLTNASPYDFNLKVGSTVELGMAVGLFDQPGNHLATDMSTYELTISNQSYTSTATSTSSTSEATTSEFGTVTTSASSTVASETSPTYSCASAACTFTVTGTGGSPSGLSQTDSRVLEYSVELAVIVVGFSAFMVIGSRRSRRS
jgi:hypothetical protein